MYVVIIIALSFSPDIFDLFYIGCDHEKWIDRNNKITQINDACKPLSSTNKHHIYNGWRDFSIINTQLSKKTLSILNLVYQKSIFGVEIGR